MYHLLMPTPYRLDELAVVREICSVDLDLENHLTIEEMATVFFIARKRVRHHQRMLTEADTRRLIDRVRALRVRLN